MPARPAYFHRLTEALDVFSQLEMEWIDRKTLQETLGVSKTVAWRVLRRCGATDGPGNSLVCRRATLLQALRDLQSTGACESEIRRRGRLEQNLASLLEAARARQIPVAPPTRSLELLSTRFGNLPTGVELTPARLTIDFQGAEDFLAKIGALVFALQNDYERVREFVETEPGRT
jgi:hypothetical protein